MHLPFAHARNQDEPQDLVAQVSGQAQRLFQNGKLLCAPAVLVVLNRALGGELSEDMAKALAAGLPIGMGGAGCACGALTGAQLALGMFMGQGRRGQKRTRKAAAALHDAFKEQCGSTCCRVLIKKVLHDKKAHMAQCARFTGLATGLAAEIILAPGSGYAGVAPPPTDAGPARPLAGRLQRVLKSIKK